MSLEAAIARCCCFGVPSTPCAQMFAACFGWPPPPSVSVVISAETSFLTQTGLCDFFSRGNYNLSIGATGFLVDEGDAGFVSWPAYRISGTASLVANDRTVDGAFDEIGGCATTVDLGVDVEGDGSCDGIVACSVCPAVDALGNCGGGQFPIAIGAAITATFPGLQTVTYFGSAETNPVEIRISASLKLDECATVPCRCAPCDPSTGTGGDISLIASAVVIVPGGGQSSYPFAGPICENASGYLQTATGRIIF